jgi:hypothetical protein
VGFEAASVAARERVLEVVGDEFDGLLADEVFASQRQHQSALLDLAFEDLPQTSTAAVQEDALVPDADADHTALLIMRSPSTSRKSTISR